MNAEYTCPYCGADFDGSEYYEQEQGIDYEVECFNCGRVFCVGYCVVPLFWRVLPEELEQCSATETVDDQCAYWNSFKDCCQFPKRTDASNLLGFVMRSECPLGNVEQTEGE